MPRKKVPREHAKRKIFAIRQLLPIPSTQGVSELADWLEVSVWAQSDLKISRQEVVSSFTFESTNDDAEEKVNTIWDELKTRAIFLKDKYSFKFSDSEEIFFFNNTPSQGVAYIFCLLLSYIGLTELTSKKTTDGSFLFEKLCSYVANKYVSDNIGSKTKNLQFGAPRKEWPASKKTFKPALKELIRQLGDGDYCSDEVRIRPSTNQGDGGLDIVAWRSFPDEKRGMFIFLGQCATAKDRNEYVEKAGDLEKFLSVCVSFKFPYILGLFVPHILSHNDVIHEESWETIKRQNNIPFDRTRIVLYGNDWQDKTTSLLLNTWRTKIKRQYSLA